MSAFAASRLGCLVVVLVVVGPLTADQPAAWSIDDVISTESIGDIQLSPDGRWAVWVHRKPDKDKDEAIAHLQRLDLTTGQETALTRGKDNCFRPRWSPDGKRLAFVRRRAEAGGKSDEEGGQIWLFDAAGGEPWPLTDWPSGVQQFGWAGSDAIVFAAREKPTWLARWVKDKQDDAVVVDDETHQPPVRLFRIDVASKKVKRLTDNRDRIESLFVAPDGRHAVAIHQRSAHFVYDNRIKPAVMLHDLQSGKSQQIFREPHWNLEHVRWAPDSRGFYAVNMHNSRPQLAQAGVLQLYYYDLDKHKSTPIDLGWECGVALQADREDATAVVPVRDGFLALLADGARNKPARFVRSGDDWRREWLTGEHAENIFALQSSIDGRALFYAHSTAHSPTQWHRARLDGSHIDKPRRFAVINDKLRKLPRARTEVVRWKGARDEEVEGILYYPHDHRPGEKRPLVVMIHGGPASASLDAWGDHWGYAANLVCQRGGFVLKPNYHGSSRYGLKWLESITGGHYGDLETVDIEKGVDSLIARGLVDPARLALSGWSNGAILTNLLTVRTTRYRAAIAGAGNVEYVSDWANCEFGDAFDRYYLGASPLQKPLLYLLKSPFYHLNRVRTPTLILFGDEDRTVPVQQGWMQYRALQQLGKTEVRFVLFPGEKHILKKLAHQRRKLKEEMAWLDKYLFR